MRNRAVWAVLFIALAVALKAPTFGDLNRHVDETFYFLVGQRMHDGLLPYVDVWDRKPFGLFLIFYLIAGISTSVVAYQVAACLFAGATAWILALMAARFTNLRGGIVAGLAYLFIIGPFQGDTGQAPDFYNLFIAAAAWLLLTCADELAKGLAGWRFWLAMLLAGVAITIKQTAAFEAAFFGLFSLWTLHKGGAGPGKLIAIALGSAALGLLPTLSIALFYWQAGHWAEFWHAMVLANLSKAYHPGNLHRLTRIVLVAAVILPLGAMGLFSRSCDKRLRVFVAGWLLAAVIAMLAIRNFYSHYPLPIMAPLSVAAGISLSHQKLWRPMLAALVIYALVWTPLNQMELRRDSNSTIWDLARTIEELDGGGGFLGYDSPPYLYALTGKPFLSPLVFSHHLNHAIERNVSHLDTDEEIDRILAKGPGVIAMSRFPRNFPVNWHSRTKVLAYARSSCRTTRRVTLREEGLTVPIIVFGDCQARSDIAKYQVKVGR